jgi:hypothetical protein
MFGVTHLFSIGHCAICSQAPHNYTFPESHSSLVFPRPLILKHATGRNANVKEKRAADQKLGNAEMQAQCR